MGNTSEKNNCCTSLWCICTWRKFWRDRELNRRETYTFFTHLSEAPLSQGGMAVVASRFREDNKYETKVSVPFLTCLQNTREIAAKIGIFNFSTFIKFHSCEGKNLKYRVYGGKIITKNKEEKK